MIGGLKTLKKDEYVEWFIKLVFTVLIFGLLVAIGLKF